jgi:hypothetical protein
MEEFLGESSINSQDIPPHASQRLLVPILNISMEKACSFACEEIEGFSFNLLRI